MSAKWPHSARSGLVQDLGGKPQVYFMISVSTQFLSSGVWKARLSE